MTTVAAFSRARAGVADVVADGVFVWHDGDENVVAMGSRALYRLQIVSYLAVGVALPSTAALICHCCFSFSEKALTKRLPKKSIQRGNPSDLHHVKPGTVYFPQGRFLSIQYQFIFEHVL